MNDTIIALASGRGKAGLAVLRLSGPEAGQVLKKLSGGKALIPRRFSVRRLTDPRTGIVLDQAGTIYMPGPKSFTGEDVTELHIHGGSAVLEAVLQAALASGSCRLAEAGEFTRRAFEHGRIDLMAAEGMADLIDAETEAQRRAALRLYEGESTQIFEGWRQILIEAMAVLEAAIDFPDEADTGADPVAPVREILSGLRSEVGKALAQAGRDKAVREGCRLVISGPPNAGKSTLLNALSGREAAIVSEIPGTTRDIVEARLDWDGFPVILQDTAGLCHSSDPVEREGVSRSHRARKSADLCLWVSEAGLPEPPENPDDIPVFNKKDLLGEAIVPEQHGYWISARTGEGVKELRKELTAKIAEILQGEEPPLAAHERHRRTLKETLCHLDCALEGLEQQREAVLISEDIRLASQNLAILTGRIGPEDLLDRIFARFCIGK